MEKGANIYQYLDNLARINHKQLETLREFESKIHKLLDNKHLIHAQLIPLLRKVSSNSKYLSQLNNSSLKIQTELTANLTGISLSAKQNSGLLQKEIMAISEINKSLYENYKILKITSLHPSLDNTEAQKKAVYIASNLNLSINNAKHIGDLAEFSKKLVNKLNLLVEEKSKILNEKINIIKYCSKTNLENLDNNLKNLVKVQESVILLSEKLENILNQIKVEYLEPYSNMLTGKTLKLKNTYKSLDQNHFLNSKTNLITKKDVIKDLKNINSEEKLKNYAKALSNCYSSSFLDAEVKEFIANNRPL